MVASFSIGFELGEKFVDAFVERGVEGVGGDLGERLEDEPPLVHRGVGQAEGGGARRGFARGQFEHPLIVQQEVEVEGAWAPVLPLGFGGSAGVALDPLEVGHQLGGRQGGGEDRGGVQVGFLPERADRLGFVSVTERDQPAVRQAIKGVGGISERAQPVAEVAPHRDAGASFVGMGTRAWGLKDWINSKQMRLLGDISGMVLDSMLLMTMIRETRPSMTAFSIQSEPASGLSRTGTGGSASDDVIDPAPERVSGGEPAVDLDGANAELSQVSAADAIRWAHERFGDRLVMTSSFGAQSAALLHLATSIVPGIPVILIDTGYLFPETYAFALDLKLRLKLNLKVFAPRITPAFLEQAHGKLWEQGEEGLDKYHQLMKIEPLQCALQQLDAQGWLAGLRAGQTEHRATLPRVTEQYGVTKVHPILHWSGKDVHEYLLAHELPYHPLVKQGYLSIGDTHSTRPVAEEGDERAGRFNGVKQECGIHLPASKAEEASWESSGL